MIYDIDGLKKHNNVVEKWHNGAEVQIKLYDGTWEDCNYPSFCYDREYRIKPAKKLVPFDFNDGLIGKVVIKKNKSLRGLITGQDNHGVAVCGMWTTYLGLLDDYLFADGSPCGKEADE